MLEKPEILHVSINDDHCELAKCDMAIINLDKNLVTEVISPEERENREIEPALTWLSSLWDPGDSRLTWEDDVVPHLKSPDPQSRILGVQRVWGSWVTSLEADEEDS